MQQGSRVQLHRAADVAQQHDRPRPPAALPAWQRRDLAGGAQAAGEGAAQIDARTAAGNPAPRAAVARIPRQPGDGRPRAREFVGGQLGEVSCRRPVRHRSTIERRSRRWPPSGRSSHRPRRTHSHPRPSASAAFEEPRGPLARPAAKNSSNNRSKAAKIFLALHQQRATGPNARRHALPGRCAAALRQRRAAGPYRRGDPSGATTARTRSDCEGGTTRHVRAISSARTPPRTASMSSLAFSNTPSVSCAESTSRNSRSSAASAATQSSVSDTPGTL